LISLVKKELKDEIKGLLEDAIPVNMILYVSLDYNRHGDLKRFTYGELKTFTHKQLREEVLA
jgi:hypothetical protein